ncbi:MAG: flagellin, partial [Pseudomonadota bacterium]
GDVTNPVNVAAFGAAIAGGDLDTLDKLTAIETTLNRALSTLQDKSSQFAGSIGILQTRDDYLKDLINTHRTGADNLTKADMNEEAANMLALQTRQQLGLSSLSIASQALQGVLRLFG